MITLIACISSNNGIGRKDGSLLFKIKEDMKRFRELTTGNICLMGRKTFDSIIEMNGKPLPNRINVLLTNDKNYKSEYGEIAFNSIDKIINHHKTMGEKDKKVYVCGGGEIYKQLLPHADEILITYVDKYVDDAEVFYPMDLQRELGFELVSLDSHYSKEYDCAYSFRRYIRSEDYEN